MHSWMEVELRIWGIDPEGATDLAQVAGARTWNVGDQRPGSSKLLFEEPGWSLRSTSGSTDSLARQLDDLVERLAGHWESVVATAQEAEVELSVAIYCGAGRKPEVGLRRDQIRMLAELGCSLDVDVYRV